MKSYLDVINETVEYYTNNLRAVIVREVEGGGQTAKCVYYDDATGAMCAIGRVLVDPKQADDEAPVRHLIATYNMDIFKPEYRHLDNIKFWTDLQQLHDGRSNWYTDGLTSFGKIMYNELVSKYGGI